MARAEVYLHAKLHLDPSNRVVTIHQCHRQDRQDSTERQDRQRPDSMGRTVLETVAQKSDEDGAFKEQTEEGLGKPAPSRSALCRRHIGNGSPGNEDTSNS